MFETWFREKFHRAPSDSEFDKLLMECFKAGMNSGCCRIKLDAASVDALLSPSGNF